MAVSGVWLLAGCQGRPAAETKRMAPDQVMQQAMTPELAQATLLLGNERYVTGQMFPSPESLAVRVAEANVRVVMQQIRERSPELRRALDSGRIGLAGGMYDLQAGRVRFFKD